MPIFRTKRFLRTALGSVVFTALLLAACLPGQPRPDRPLAAPHGSPAPATPLPEGAPVARQNATATPVMAQVNYLWVLNQADGTLVAIDPNQNAAALQIPLGGVGVALAVEPDAAWVGVRDEQGHDYVQRHETRSGKLITRIPIEQGSVRSLAVAAGKVWVGVAEPAAETIPARNDYRLPGGIAVIDPGRDEISGYYPTAAIPIGLELMGEQLWALQKMVVFTSLDRIDLITGQVTALPGQEDLAQAQQFATLAAGQAGLWATSAQLGAHYIYELDPATGTVLRAVAVGEDSQDTPRSLLVGTQEVWVALPAGRVVRIDAASGAVTANLNTGADISELFFGEGWLWAVSQAGGQVFRVEPASSLIVAGISMGSPAMPTPTPSLRPPPGMACADSYESHLKIGMKAKVNPEPPVPNRLRAEPSMNGKVVGQVDPGKVVEVVEGPACANRWVWWEVRDSEQLISGWTAEGNGEEYWLVPAE